MVNLFLDPFIFACPTLDEGFDEFDRYIKSILLWKDLREQSWASIFTSAATCDVLNKTRSYPFWESFETFGGQYTQRKDIISLVYALLTKLPAIEDKIMIKEVLWDNFQCEPTYYLVERHPDFIEHFQRLILLMSLFCTFETIKEDDQILITRNLHKDKEIAKVACDIIDCEFVDNSVQFRMPRSVSNSFPLCENPHGLCLSANPITIWATSTKKADYQKALSINTYKMICASKSTILDTKSLSWAFGQNFIRTAEAFDFLHQENKIKMLLRACSETILEEAMRGVHDLREGKGGNSTQKKYGDYKACRRDINYEFHLHYWETPSGPVFADLVVHNDETITPPDEDIEYISIQEQLPHLVKEQED